MLQLILHLTGDFLLQSDWMARNKARSNLAALAHAITYTLPFGLVLHPSFIALTAIACTHFFIDRFRLARFVVWAKNFIAPPSQWKSWGDCDPDTGYCRNVSSGLALTLLALADATLHLSINYCALRWL